MTRSDRATIFALLALPLAGCLRPPAGDDGGQFGEESGVGCVAVDRRPLGDDEVSPLGFAPRALLDLAVPATVPLDWADGAATDLALDPSRDGGAAFVDYEWDARAGGPEPALGCPDRVEVGFVLGFATADGAFAEALELVLAAETAGVAEGSAAPDAFAGTFDPWAFAPEGADFDAVSAQVAVAFATGGPSGAVVGQGEAVDGEVASATSFPIATFGEAAP